MRAALDDLAVVDHQHLVGIADGGQAVGDDKAGAPFHQAQQGLLQVLFGARVHVAGGLIQDQDIRVGQHGAGDCQQLALPLAQVRAALGQHGLVAVRQAVDEQVGVGQSGRGHHLFVAGLQPPVADIFHHRVGEQEVILQHQPQLAAQIVFLHDAHIHARRSGSSRCPHRRSG